MTFKIKKTKNFRTCGVADSLIGATKGTSSTTKKKNPMKLL